MWFSTHVSGTPVAARTPAPSDPVGDQVAIGEKERDLDVNVMDLAGDELAHGPHPGTPRRQSLVGQVVNEVLTHQLIHDPVVRVVLELVLEPAYHLRVVHPSSRPSFNRFIEYHGSRNKVNKVVEDR